MQRCPRCGGRLKVQITGPNPVPVDHLPSHRAPCALIAWPTGQVTTYRSRPARDAVLRGALWRDANGRAA